MSVNGIAGEDDQYVVAFNRDRDDYQVAAALAEGNRLAYLATDYYEGASRVHIPGLVGRTSPLVSPRLAHSTPVALGAQAMWLALRRVHHTIPFPLRLVDGSIGRHARRQIERTAGAPSLIYSGYAQYAWRRGQTGLRILFQFHPGAASIRRSLLDDELLGRARWIAEPEERKGESDRTFARELDLAHRVIAASQYTAQSVAEQYPMMPVAVVPYGCPPVAPSALGPRTAPRFLFVGQGVRRKGLHLLLEAWRQAKTTGSTLRIVASRLDPAIERMAEGMQNVSITSVLSSEALAWELGRADTLVLPSLVEGFGLVIGEAIAAGCRVIATTNTGLPDYAPSAAVGRVLAPGRVAPLVEAIEDFISTFATDDPGYRSAAAALAKEHDWAAFRRGIRNAL